MSEETLLHCRNLVVGHRGRALLPPIHLSIHRRQTWALMGPNGSGKTTLLRTVLGLQPALSGDLDRRGAAIGYVPQRSELDPSVPARALDLVRAGAERGWSFVVPTLPWTRRAAVSQALSDAGVSQLCHEPWQHLSEGQKQRVLMAQALAGTPDMLILDEPTSAMDPHGEQSVFELLAQLGLKRHLGLLIVSHNLNVLTRYATHGLFVDKDQGVALPGPIADVLNHPAFVARFGVQMVPRGLHER